MKKIILTILFSIMTISSMCAFDCSISATYAEISSTSSSKTYRITFSMSAQFSSYGFQTYVALPDESISIVNGKFYPDGSDLYTYSGSGSKYIYDSTYNNGLYCFYGFLNQMTIAKGTYTVGYFDVIVPTSVNYPVEIRFTGNVVTDTDYTSHTADDTSISIVSNNTVSGDINNDGQVDNADVTAIVDAYLNNESATPATDLDGDGELTIADVTKLIGLMNMSGSIYDANGHEFVDLGLPSGALWATCNVGATSPDQPGDFYAWGETETKDVFSWETYQWCDGDVCNTSNQTLTKYCDRGGYGWLDGKISLEPDDDVAHMKWKGDWHIPTKDEFQELMDYCTFEYFKIDKSMYGYRITGTNGNSIVMPAAGYWKDDTYRSNNFYYWSADISIKDTPENNHATHAVCLHATSEEVDQGGGYRYYGYSVRPVLSFYTPVAHSIFDAPSMYMGHELVDLGLPSAALWATCNLGASSPEENGCYYAWGELTGSCEGKTEFSPTNYPVDMTEQVELYENLPLSADAAAASWGGEWRMPTYNDLSQLKNKYYTVWEWTNVNGVDGYRVTSIVKGFEGNSIFLPAAGDYDTRNAGTKGYYWSSTVRNEPDISNDVGYIYFNSSKVNLQNNFPWEGLTIRPVISYDAINP